MTDWAIDVQNVSKYYRRDQPSKRNMHETIERTLRAPLRQLRTELAPQTASWERTCALRDVCFQIKAGESVGLIGHNGAGKSVLLKILARVTHPSSGEVWLRGHVGAVLEVGAGFHREFTGRENVYLHAAILGMKKNEIARKFDEIVAFSGIEEFLDVPLKHYSSGMEVRLAFAIAANLDSELLLVDEVLAIADETFQIACIDKFKALSREGRTLLLVSHDLNLIAQLCPRTILLNKGEVIVDGETDRVAEFYHRDAVA